MQNYTDQDLAALIKSVEEEFDANIEEMKKSEKTEVEVESKENQELEKSEDPSESFEIDEEEIKSIEDLYSSMDKSEAQAHYKSLSKVLGVEESSEENLNKSEKDSDVLLKSENDQLKSQNEELKKSVENLTSALSSFLKKSSAPERKAITNIEYIKKSESENKTEDQGKDLTKLSKAQIGSTLKEKIREGKLSKSERELVVDFYDNKVTINDIKHLL